MSTFAVRIDGCQRELQAGIAAIKTEFPHRVRDSRRGHDIIFEKLRERQNVSLRVERTGSLTRILYNRPVHAFRALGRVLGEGEVRRSRIAEETSAFDVLGVMLDASRNAVPTERTLQSFLCRFALMGIDTLMLYTEDTYEVPGEPFFGYLRGGYTQAELKRLDRFASGLGIEMFACIQTLGHMGQVLQWPAYAGYLDTPSILLAGEEKTYALIEKMIRAASTPFRSRRIHIGMDEAHGLGTEEYKRRHGARDPFAIFNEHLARVRAICRRYGLKPMIWSDMYFRLGSKHDHYYDKATVIPQRVIDKIPRDVELVYWDYYHHDGAFYRDWIRRHRRLGSEPIMATGVWSWDHFWTALPHTFSALDACMGACRAEKVREVFATMWGDDGVECDFYSGLPGLQYFAELAYQKRADRSRLQSNFRGSCDANYADWCEASHLDSVPGMARPERSATNISKILLWEDPFLAFADPHLKGVSLREHYRTLARTLENTSQPRLRFPAALARALTYKCELRRELARAYKKHDKVRLRQLVSSDLGALRKEVNNLWRVHRRMWFDTYKPFGWEVMERRYGGLLARLDTVGQRVMDYVNGAVDSIPELEVKLRPTLRTVGGGLPYARHARVATPSLLK